MTNEDVYNAAPELFDSIAKNVQEVMNGGVADEGGLFLKLLADVGKTADPGQGALLLDAVADGACPPGFGWKWCKMIAVGECKRCWLTALDMIVKINRRAADRAADAGG